MNDFVRSMREIENLRGHTKEEVEVIKEGILNMASNPRDTQFQGFAHALLLQLAAENALALNWDRFFGELELTIARRAYDLVNSGLIALDLPEHMCDIPDMTELPKESS
jgi:hypothetical protein